MPKISDFAFNVQAESGGIWVKHPAGFRFKIARANNPDYEQMLLEEFIDHTPSRDEINDLLPRLISYTCLKDWREVLDPDCNEIPFSNDKAFEILSDKRYRAIFLWILQVAQDNNRYLEKNVESAEKNSVNASSGS